MVRPPVFQYRIPRLTGAGSGATGHPPAGAGRAGGHTGRARAPGGDVPWQASPPNRGRGAGRLLLGGGSLRRPSEPGRGRYHRSGGRPGRGQHRRRGEEAGQRHLGQALQERAAGPVAGRALPGAIPEAAPGVVGPGARATHPQPASGPVLCAVHLRRTRAPL